MPDASSSRCFLQDQRIRISEQTGGAAGVQEYNLLVGPESPFANVVEHPGEGFTTVYRVEQQALLPGQHQHGFVHTLGRLAVTRANVITVSNDVFAADATWLSDQFCRLASKTEYAFLLHILRGVHADAENRQIAAARAQSDDEPTMRTRTAGGSHNVIDLEILFVQLLQ